MLGGLAFGWAAPGASLTVGSSASGGLATIAYTAAGSLDTGGEKTLTGAVATAVFAAAGATPQGGTSLVSGGVATFLYSAAGSTPVGGDRTLAGAVATVVWSSRGALAIVVTGANPEGHAGGSSGSGGAVTVGGVQVGGQDWYVQTVAPTWQIAPDWLFVVCDLQGNQIAAITRTGFAKRLIARSNRPLQLSFSVPSDDPLTRILHTDGYPYVTSAKRVVRGYRREYGAFTLRFSGVIAQVQDVADADRSLTHVVAVDPFQRLFRRIVRNAAGSRVLPAGLRFTSQQGSVIAKALVDRTNTYLGNSRITTDAGFGAVFEATAAQTVDFPEGTSVAEALMRLADTGTMDLVFDPIDYSSSYHAVFSVVAERGSNKPNAIFCYGMGNHSIRSFQRLEDGDLIANDVTVYRGPRPSKGAAWLRSNAVSAASQTAHDKFESVRYLWEQESAAFTQQLADEERDLRADPRVLLSIVPMIERAPVPFTDYWLGDRIQVYISGDAARQSLAASQRVYGVTISIEDDGFETVEEIVASANQG
jgi:hypothetical protein